MTQVIGKWIGRILLALVLAAVVVGLWKREEISRLLAVNSLFSEEKIVENFSNMDAAFLTRAVSRGAADITDLPRGQAIELPQEVISWISNRHVTSLLILHDGQIVYEVYLRGTHAEDRRISWSVAKSYLSALFGILHRNGTSPSLDDPVTKYAPVLRGTAYDGPSIRNVLNMASGVTFDEDYLDYNSDINRMGRVIALGGTLDSFAASLTETFTDPGAEWKYVSIDTHVLGMVIRGATGRPVSELLSEHILTKLGQERDAYYITDGAGIAFVLGGLNLTTRDYARFGQMIEQNGQWNGEQIVPADWITESTSPTAPTKPGEIGYGFQWWIPHGSEPGQFMARGIYGQYIYIDQQRDVVIATTAADRKFRDTGINDRNIEIFRKIAEYLE